MAATAAGAFAVAAVILSLACSTSDSSREPDTADASREPAAGPDTMESRSGVAAASWYSRSRTLDLTGDGRADSVHLEARGERPDSMRIALSFCVAGDEKHREEWGSGYELALIDSTAPRSPGVEEVLRSKLDSVLASVIVQPFDAPGVRLMAEDSAVLAGLDPRPTRRVSFSYGYESTTRLAWDAPRSRFVRLWSCC